MHTLFFQGHYDKPTLINYTTTQPVARPHDSMVMNCEVNFTNSSVASTTMATCQRRWSSRQSATACTNATITHRLPGNHFNISLPLSNITEEDQAVYTLSISYSEKCSFSCPDISLRVADWCFGRTPEPVNPGMVNITAPHDASQLSLVANFTGDTDSARFSIVWSNSSTRNLKRVGTRNKYFTKRSIVSTCLFTEELIIRNVTMLDAGMYEARAAGLQSVGNVTYFKVNIDQEESSHLSLLVIVVIVVVTITLATAVGICIGVYTYRRKYRLRSDGTDRLLEQEDHDLEDTIQGTVWAPAQPITEQKKVLILYCKDGMPKEKLKNLVEIFFHCPGIEPHIDFIIPNQENWNRWIEKELKSDYVILICTSELYSALMSSENVLVEMYEGRFHSNSIIDTIQPSKIIPVFIDSREDLNLIPERLHDRRSFELSLTQLWDITRGDIFSMQLAISYNSDFHTFQELLEYLLR